MDEIFLIIPILLICQFPIQFLQNLLLIFQLILQFGNLAHVELILDLQCVLIVVVHFHIAVAVIENRVVSMCTHIVNRFLQNLQLIPFGSQVSQALIKDVLIIIKEDV